MCAVSGSVRKALVSLLDKLDWCCRPVELHKWLLVGNKLYNSQEKEIAQINCKPTWKTNDTEPCAMLAQETLTQGHSVLIFCCSKKVGW